MSKNNPPSPDTPESWDRASKGYASRVAPFMMASFTDAFIERLGTDKESRVLEVGAGSGALTATLARNAHSVLATDFAPAMIEILRDTLASEGIDNVQTEVMDGQSLPLPDDAFDAAASSFAVMLFPDRARGFAELNRVVKPGGRVVVSGWAGPDRFEAFGLFLGTVKRAFPDLPPPPAPPPVFSLSDPAAFGAEMEAAGFGDVNVEYVSRDLEVGGFAEMWGMLTTGAPPVQMLLDRVGVDGQAKLRDTLATIVAERFGDGPIRFTNAATFGVGVAS